MERKRGTPQCDGVVPPRYVASAQPRRPLVPKTYQDIYERAALATSRALADGIQAAEVEFPPIPQLNRAGDGSASGVADILKSNVALCTAILKSVATSRQVGVLVFDARVRDFVANEVGDSALVATWMHYTPERGMENVDVVLAIQPAADEQWEYLEKLPQRVVVLNGVFRNGLDWLTPVYYLKPCSGWGVLCREWPGKYIAVSFRTGMALPGEIQVLQQGRIRRPNIPAVFQALKSDFLTRTDHES